MNARDDLDARARVALTAFLNTQGNQNWPRCGRCGGPVERFYVLSLPPHMGGGGQHMVAECHGQRQAILLAPGVLAQLYRDLEAGRAVFSLVAFVPRTQIGGQCRLDGFRDALNAAGATARTEFVGDVTIHFQTEFTP